MFFTSICKIKVTLGPQTIGTIVCCSRLSTLLFGRLFLRETCNEIWILFLVFCINSRQRQDMTYKNVRKIELYQIKM